MHRVLCAALVCAAIAPSLADASPVARAAGRCADVGPANSDVGLYKVVAKRITCARARGVLTGWYNDRSAPNSGPRGWRCRTYQQSQLAFRTYCFRGQMKISYTQYSA
jgi:hypothetical protein